MALYTVQTFAESGNWSCPDGRQSLTRCRSLGETMDTFSHWVDEVSQFDDERCAYAYAWRGHHRDVTDLCPDFRLTLGPRLGIRREPC